MKNLVKLGELFTICIVIFSALMTGFVWVTKPHAEDFVRDIHKEEQKIIVQKLDSLSEKSEKRWKNAEKKFLQVSYILIKTLPKEERLQAMKEYKEWFDASE